MKNFIIFLLLILAIALAFLAASFTTGYELDTPTGQVINQGQDLIIVPVKAYVIKYEDDKLSSIRTKENIEALFNDVNQVWQQANIYVDLTKVEEITLPNSLSSNTIDLYNSFLQSEYYNKNQINALFDKSIGSNGIAFPNKIIMVADETSVFDFRATSHEIGHVLGLQHVPPVNRLMARGVNGFDLTQEEIKIARNNALSLFY